MRKFIALVLIISVHCSLFSQERTQIPYSIYGVGKIQPKGFARNYAMGRTGIAISSSKGLNNLNPASYYSIDSVSFFFDIGMGLDATKYSTTINKAQRGVDVNIRDIAIGFRINSWWTSGIGIAPFSTVGYKVVTKEPITGSIDEYFTAQIVGSGGLNQFYWNNSIQLFKGFNAGVSFNYLFGNIRSTEQISSTIVNSFQYNKRTSYYHKVYADFGFQYYFPFKNDYKITIGGVFGNNHNINIKNQVTMYDSQGRTFEDETLSRNTFDFPMYIGGGIALNYKESLTVTMDYLHNDWSSAKSTNRNFSYENNSIYRLGAELIPGKYASLGYFGGIAYRAGLYYEQSYLKIDGVRFADKGATVGFGFPFLQNRTTINVSYNFGINGTLENNLIKERYHSFMFSIAMHDWWFIKRKFD